MKMQTTYNPKLSSEKFTIEELRMIREIKKAGYKIEFTKDSKGATLFEPYKSIITGKIYNREIAYTSTLNNWSKDVYPLKDWYNHIIDEQDEEDTKEAQLERMRNTTRNYRGAYIK